MSMPNIPDIKPDIILNREDVVNLLLTSIALEEISFSHIINAEAEKIQFFLKDECLSLKDAISVNSSVEQMMRGILTNQMLLMHKLGDVMKLIDTIDPIDECEPDLCHDPSCSCHSKHSKHDSIKAARHNKSCSRKNHSHSHSCTCGREEDFDE